MRIKSGRRTMCPDSFLRIAPIVFFLTVFLSYPIEFIPPVVQYRGRSIVNCSSVWKCPSWVPVGRKAGFFMISNHPIQIRELQLRDPFGISRGTKRSVRNLFLRIGEGWGEGAPIYYRGQTVEQMERIAGEWLENPPNLARSVDHIVDEFRERYPLETGLCQAIDLALHDAWGKQQGKPLHQLWNIPWRSPIVSSFTIGMDDMDTMMRKVEKADACPILKVKVGGDQDLAVLRAIHARTKKSLYVDANGGWTLPQAIEYLPVLKECGVRVLEQPLPDSNLESYIRLRMANTTEIPILVDESVHGLEDIAEWVGLADGINIKLAKCGGLSRARRMIDNAQQNGLKVMIGCMVESSLGVTAAAHLAPLVDFVDLDGAALLEDDPFVGMKFEEGRLTIPEAAGIGAIPR